MQGTHFPASTGGKPTKFAGIAETPCCRPCSAAFEVDNKPVFLLYAPFCRVAASPYPAYKNQHYQSVIRNL